MNKNGKVARVLKKSEFLKRTYRAAKIMSGGIKVTNTAIEEIMPLRPRKAESQKLRLNLLVPSIKKEHVFGGISTALKFFNNLADELGAERRLLVLDANVSKKDIENGFSDYVLVPCSQNVCCDKQIVDLKDRKNETFPVTGKDLFIATGWWTAYTIAPVIKWQAMTYQQKIKNLIYLIQDYEPNFYPWSTRYMLAEGTYKMDIPTTAVFNSSQLRDYFKANGYVFDKEYCFDPVLNEVLKRYLNTHPAESVQRKKQILVYGRPSVSRNAFELLIDALMRWSEEYPEAREWKVYSAGEQFDNIELKNKVVLEVLGKLSLEQYAKFMTETYAGISLMVSPHPSYPPLEMSTFGIKTITNTYANKDLKSFNESIVSLKYCTPEIISNELTKICIGYQKFSDYSINREYLRGHGSFFEVIQKLAEEV